MKKQRVFLILLSTVLGSLLTACVVDEGGERPRRTQGEYAVYSSLYILQTEALYNLRTAVGFDAYLRQTTDLGRSEVVARFFPWARIIEQKDYGWRLQDDELGTMYYDFLIKDGLLLGQPGASWLCYRRYSSETAVQLICDLSTEGNSIRYKGYPYIDSQTDWLADVTLTGYDFSVSFTGSSSYEYKSDRYDEDTWTVDCRTETPLQWADRNGRMTAGAVSVTAVLAAAKPRTISFRAEHSRGRLQITAESGYTEVWDWVE